MSDPPSPVMPSEAASRPASGASSSVLAPPPPPSTLRGRVSSRTAPASNVASSAAPSLSRRRSSLLSFSSLDDSRHSAGDFIRPGLGLGLDDDPIASMEEPSHWHSSPLAFAFLPALAGLFFTNGSAFVTDVLLLALAALFLNWSVRLPWDWYRSAQQQLSPTDHDKNDHGHDHDHDKHEQQPDDLFHATTEQEQAAADLRQHETLALISTFIFPACAAYLLHVIRGQLSRPSEGLVSDYNLSIFILAAEIRPVRQLIRLTTNRTLHLQRIVSKNIDPATLSKKDSAMAELTSRLVLLEDKLGHQQTSPGGALVQKDEMASLSIDIKKRYEPRLDALERAVRRYEKRATTLTLLTEQRLLSLENRLQDALSLAAVAAHSSAKPGIISMMLATIAKTMMLPLEAVWFLLVWPLVVTESLLKKAGAFFLGPPKLPRRRNDSRPPKSRSEKKKEDGYFSRHY